MNENAISSRQSELIAKYNKSFSESEFAFKELMNTLDSEISIRDYAVTTFKKISVDGSERGSVNVVTMFNVKNGDNKHIMIVDPGTVPTKEMKEFVKYISSGLNPTKVFDNSES